MNSNDFRYFQKKKSKLLFSGGGRNKARMEDLSPLTSEERKDSLSVNVAFVKFHISRSRKINYGRMVGLNLPSYIDTDGADNATDA